MGDCYEEKAVFGGGVDLSDVRGVLGLVALVIHSLYVFSSLVVNL
jgi:hypothetical protein